jgi:hypothetical protein
MQSVCQFCWQYSTTLDKTPEQTFITADAALKNNWYAFLDQELDEQWGMQHFPTWLLIKEPGISHYIEAIKQTPESFKLLQQLTRSELKDKVQAIALRKRLHQTHPGVLEFYLKSV